MRVLLTLLPLLVPSTLAGQTSVHTVAGTGAPGYSGDGGPAIQATLNEPSHCSFGPKGELYVSDAATHTVRRLDPDGKIHTVAGCGEKGYDGDGGPATKAHLNEPYGVFADRRSNLYVVDRLNCCIRRVDGKTGVITTIAGRGHPGYSGDGGPANRAQMREPHGIALSADEKMLYIADVADCRIRVIDLTTSTISTVAGDGKRAFTGDGGPAINASIHGARAVAVGRDGTVYICEREGNRIRKIDPPTGVITTIAGTGAAGYSGDGGPALQATFRGPKWITLDDFGAIYVVDTENHAVRRIDPATGIITTVAGTGKSGGEGDGKDSAQAQLARPHGCCIYKGVLCVADTENHRVRAFPMTHPGRAVSTLDRLKPEYLRRLHDEIEALKAKRVAVTLKTGFKDYRCVLHAHSYLSHDSRGTIAEIAAAAKTAHIDALFLSNHPKKDVDVVTAGQKEPVGGVLFVSGAETNGFLAYPGDGKLPRLDVGEQAFVDSIRSNKGMVFVAHPEEHVDWSLKGLTGTEVYNTHADVMDETELMQALQPRDRAGYLRLLGILNAVRDNPREVFAALFDQPLENLAHYDELSKQRAYAAIAGNDSHQNTGFIFRGLEDDKIAIEDPLGERKAVLDAKKNPLLTTLFGKPEPGKELMRRLLDPYAVSFGYVSTHVLAKERSVASLEQALRDGRTYVAFDWMGDPTGTLFQAYDVTKNATIGDAFALHTKMMLVAETPLPCTLRIMRDGQEIARAEGRQIYCSPNSPGVYRMEAWLTVGGEMRPWIYTGAIRIER